MTRQKYIEYQFNVCRELCTKYGKISVFWFDAAWYNNMFTAEMWDSEKLTRMIRELQPGIIINNRASIPGDFDTPEQHLGTFQDWRAWESCMCVTKTWSYSGSPPKPLNTLIHMIASNACGDGNVLMSWGPHWDGEFDAAETKRLEEIGAWLKANGESIYGTRGGPWKPAAWGGSTHRGDKAYLHIFTPQAEGLTLPSLPGLTVRSAKLLNGSALKFDEANGKITIQLPSGSFKAPDTIVELTMNKSLDGVKAVDSGRITIFNDTATYGTVVSHEAKVTTSSQSQADPGHPERLVMDNAPAAFAFHTSETDAKPWVQLDLGKVYPVTGVRVVNRADCCQDRAQTLALSVSTDGKDWHEVWHAEGAQPGWDIPVTDTLAGAQVPGRKVRYLRLSLQAAQPTPLHLRQVEVWAKPLE